MACSQNQQGDTNQHNVWLWSRYL